MVYLADRTGKLIQTGGNKGCIKGCHPFGHQPLTLGVTKIDPLGKSSGTLSFRQLTRKHTIARSNSRIENSCISGNAGCHSERFQHYTAIPTPTPQSESTILRVIKRPHFSGTGMAGRWRIQSTLTRNDKMRERLTKGMHSVPRST
ncbi:hypothetical protein DSM101010T_15730 [Desulfovibrio subterraneus]|uniref:Uncharacterized protein n=1 Tax=Desulfovibrio subterraneus TaxID=2718620 RepID=A0A7J0BI19_9BACT|nr:hypothetical protein DSM101010T_15730 [Desulfovibrio subterraneus]